MPSAEKRNETSLVLEDKTDSSYIIPNDTISVHPVLEISSDRNKVEEIVEIQEEDEIQGISTNLKDETDSPHIVLHDIATVHPVLEISEKDKVESTVEIPEENESREISHDGITVDLLPEILAEDKVEEVVELIIKEMPTGSLVFQDETNPPTIVSHRTGSISSLPDISEEDLKEDDPSKDEEIEINEIPEKKVHKASIDLKDETAPLSSNANSLSTLPDTIIVDSSSNASSRSEVKGIFSISTISEEIENNPTEIIDDPLRRISHPLQPTASKTKQKYSQYSPEKPTPKSMVIIENKKPQQITIQKTKPAPKVTSTKPQEKSWSFKGLFKNLFSSKSLTTNKKKKEDIQSVELQTFPLKSRNQGDEYLDQFSKRDRW